MWSFQDTQGRKESALYLSTTNLTPLHCSIPTLNQNNLWEAMLSAVQRVFGGEREDNCRGKDDIEACHHTCSPCLCYMMPDVLRCCATSAMMLKKTHVHTHPPVCVIHSCCHSQLCEPREQDFPTRHRELITRDMCGCLSTNQVRF